MLEQSYDLLFTGLVSILGLLATAVLYLSPVAFWAGLVWGFYRGGLRFWRFLGWYFS
jgi:hypothetical protein